MAVTDPRVAPWEIDEKDFPFQAPIEEQIKFLLGYAVLAPSIYNVQPWQFSFDSGGLLVFRDQRVQLHYIDPTGREQRISIGAAILNLRVAAAHFGFACRVVYTPEPQKPELVAKIFISRQSQPDAEAAKLFPAIAKRRTIRDLYTDRPLELSQLESLQQSVLVGSTGLQLITEKSFKARVAELIAAAGHKQVKDPQFRKEMSRWMRASWSLKEDGLAADLFGIPSVLSGFGSWIMRSVGLGIPRLLTEFRLSRDSSAIAVFFSKDHPDAWVACGESLQRFLLSLTMEGLSCAFHNQAAQVLEVRAALRDMLHIADWPQIVLRIGYSSSAALPSARRAVDRALRTAAIQY